MLLFTGACEKVARPIDLGGFGSHNLQIMTRALQVRWIRLEKTSEERPWASLDFPVHPQVQAMFAISVVTQDGNGNTFF